MMGSASCERRLLMEGTEMKIANEMTAPQQRALLNIADGRSSSHGLCGRSEMGGHTRTMMALCRTGLVTLKGALTDRGHDVVQVLNRRRA